MIIKYITILYNPGHKCKESKLALAALTCCFGISIPLRKAGRQERDYLKFS